MKRLIIALLVGGALTVSVAFAADLGTITSGEVGIGDATVTSCDTNGVDVAYTVDYIIPNFKITEVTVSGIDAGCSGQTVDVVLTDNGVEVASGSGTADASGTEVVSVSPWPAVFVDDIHVAIHD